MLVRGWLRSHLLQRHALGGGLLVLLGARIPSSSPGDLLGVLLCWLCIVLFVFCCLPCCPFCYRPCFAAVAFMLVKGSVGYIPPHFEQVALAVGCLLLRTPTIVFVAFRRCTLA
jgi:hypothetical protein